MKSVLLVSAFFCASLLAACGVPEKLAYADDSEVLVPESVVSESGYEILTSYPQPGSPTLTRGWNGRVTVTCPRGYHFDARTIDPINDGDEGASATCEANEPPKT